MRNVSRVLIVAAAAALTVSGCVASEQASDEPPGDTLTFEEESNACTADDITVDGAAGEKPTITLPTDCDPPAELVVEDLAPGDGAEATEGSTVMTNYLLVSWSDGQEVDTSFGREPFPVENVGQAQVIPGWNQGMIGIKQGGRRLLIIPPDLGYGEQGQPPIQPNETLVFVVDAVEVTPA
jgi:peptidylprolyl isomerase